MNTQVIEKEGIIVISAEGRLDTTNSSSFENLLQNYFDKKDINIRIDLSKLSYISSSGLRCFIALQKNVKNNNGNLVLCGLSTEIMDVFVMTGFSKIFTIE